MDDNEGVGGVLGFRALKGLGKTEEARSLGRMMSVSWPEGPEGM